MTDHAPRGYLAWSPPIQVGIHLTRNGDNFRLATSIRNPLDDGVDLKTGSGGLFKITMRERTFTEDGAEWLWSPQVARTQAEARWRIEPLSTVTQHWHIPNEEQAQTYAEEEREEYRSMDLWSDDTIDEMVSPPPSVDPEEVGVVRVSVSVPSIGNYHETVTRQFDLRNDMDRALDEDLPPEQSEGIHRKSQVAVGP